jgi:hypothetical protein
MAEVGARKISLIVNWIYGRPIFADFRSRWQTRELPPHTAVSAAAS